MGSSLSLCRQGPQGETIQEEGACLKRNTAFTAGWHGYNSHTLPKTLSSPPSGEVWLGVLYPVL